MSTAAAPNRSSDSSRHTPTRGYSQIPNSLIENRAAFTDAEFSLALIIIRRGGAGDSVTVSDSNWERWTGMSPRTKEYAVAGLKAKGFNAEGRGDGTRFRFEHKTWEMFVRTGGASAKPRTLGRKTGVSPKIGAKVHPSCRGKGCALLEHENTQSALSLFVVTPNAQPVAQTEIQNGECRGPENSGKRESPLLVTPNAQPVAQTEISEQVWPLTLAAVRAAFPSVGTDFVNRLLGVVRQTFPDASDVEISAAVERAWLRKHRRQDSEGLFLVTVPEQIAAKRRQPNKPPPVIQDITPGVVQLVSLVRAKVKQLHAERAGPGFNEHLAALDQLLLNIVPGADMAAIEQSCERIEAAIVKRLEETISEPERETVALAVDQALDPYRKPARFRGPMNKVQLEKLGEGFRARSLLDVVGLPRLSLFYV